MHTGKGIISETDHSVLLLCPYGHLIDYMPKKEWAGSGAEYKWSNIIVKCDGTLSGRRGENE